MNSLPQNKDSLISDFESYLLTEKRVSSKTLRNYRSDLAHFLGFLSFHLSSQGHTVNHLQDMIPHYSAQTVGAYKGFHINNKIPQSTTNRRLSTVRNFTNFLIAKGVINHNPLQNITNIVIYKSNEERSEDLLACFGKELLKANASKITVKNYLSDVRHFLGWLNKNAV